MEIESQCTICDWYVVGSSCNFVTKLSSCCRILRISHCSCAKQMFLVTNSDEEFDS